jgi:hypothetical protein
MLWHFYIACHPARLKLSGITLFGLVKTFDNRAVRG